jgi:hypothetical protein
LFIPDPSSKYRVFVIGGFFYVFHKTFLKYREWNQYKIIATSVLRGTYIYIYIYIVKENSSPTQGGAGFALQVGFQTPERIGPRTMTLVA